jgi:hypothetical protein
MAFTIVPIIKESKVVEFSIQFDDPLSISNFKALLEKIHTELDYPNGSKDHLHNFISFPFFSDGEMIATIEKCSCGKTIRHSL